jgi:hypothetical protein
MHARHTYVLSDQHLVETGCTIEEEQPGVPGGRLAKVQAEGSASDEEEEWYDATEEVEAVPLPAGGSWWEQDNVDAADVEAHLLKDIHQKGMLRHAVHACCVTCQSFMLHSCFHHLTQLPALANNNLAVPIPYKCLLADSHMTCHVAPCTQHEVQRTAGTVEAHTIVCKR